MDSAAATYHVGESLLPAEPSGSHEVVPDEARLLLIWEHLKAIVFELEASSLPREDRAEKLEREDFVGHGHQLARPCRASNGTNVRVGTHPLSFTVGA